MTEGTGDFDKLVPLSDVAKLLHCSKRTVQRMIAAGDLPKAQRVGRESALWRSQVLALISQMKGELA